MHIHSGKIYITQIDHLNQFFFTASSLFSSDPQVINHPVALYSFKNSLIPPLQITHDFLFMVFLTVCQTVGDFCCSSVLLTVFLICVNFQMNTWVFSSARVFLY